MGTIKRDGQNNVVYIPDQAGIAALNNRAISEINNAFTLDPRNHTTWHNRGWLYLNIGNYPQCIEDCSRAIEIDPSLPWTWNNGGVAYRRLKKWKEAIGDFEHALSLNPNYQLAINNRREAVGARRFRIVKRGVIIAGVIIAAIVIASLSI